jgi:hypothetical protein
VRITLDLDDELVAALTARHPELSKTKAIEAAIKAYLKESAVAELRRRAGTMEIEDVSASLRLRDTRI